ncbi:hypothetical protein L195_g041646 [Trifolium pratense]|uniref:Uncharacterized protein n=1 Tax=Trifolium pratense TaxID=57577 RepID=A0A2K3M463_TRIPR|nr:hypothetical protein L195_g041646 [Trifolium pratense]
MINGVSAKCSTTSKAAFSPKASPSITSLEPRTTFVMAPTHFPTSVRRTIPKPQRPSSQG